MSDSLQPHELQHTRPPCPSPTPRVYSNSCPSSRWCHPAISSSVVPCSSCLQSLPASGSFPVSQLFAWGGQNIGVSASASVLPMNTQDWSPLGWTGWIFWHYWHLKDDWTLPLQLLIQWVIYCVKLICFSTCHCCVCMCVCLCIIENFTHI